MFTTCIMYLYGQVGGKECTFFIQIRGVIEKFVSFSDREKSTDFK